MSIEDEIRAKKEKMQADMREAERKKQEADRLAKALRDAGMSSSSPVLIVPATELQTIIAETMPKMSFSKPKVVRTMPDKRTLARVKGNNDRADMYSFDVVLFTDGSGKGSSTYEMWVFKNGAIAFSNNSTGNLTWANVKKKGIDASAVRAKIIETLASQAIQNERSYSSSTSSSGSSSGGCYIATAVYGTYDCPEVWVLRRYRDFQLKRTALGRAFVKTYYAISPKLVKWFGNKHWFTAPWKKYLDKKVSSLKAAGYSDEQYND